MQNRLVVLLMLVSGSALAARPAKPPPAPVVAPEPPPPPPPTPESIAAFADVYKVLHSPRCLNCHPVGDAPLQRDASTPHQMGITRFSGSVGLACNTCHRPTGIDAPHLPPANPEWRMPPANQAFEGRSPAQLCAQLKDVATTGGRDLPTLLHHVSEDPLVLWGWSPGAGRTTPPLSHDAFVAAFSTWVSGGAGCPSE
ncbi:hypothetical protein LBMAG42_27630 [Deltaproteobacteria bacterium]|nr:hypothetical protein LBMAG42_27630 [Deltaproteobacteria bacterium]